MRPWGTALLPVISGRTKNRHPRVDVWSTDDLAAGRDHSCALLDDNTVRCWGNNGNGQLGDKTFTKSKVPVVTNLTQSGKVDALAAAEYTTCALTASKQIWCWGANNMGQIGDGTTVDRNEPTLVKGLSGMKAVALGGAHTCAVGASAGEVWCWGLNARGQLGDGTYENRLAAVKVSGISGADSVTAGESHTCALLSAGTAACWGGNYYYQLGSAPPYHKLKPAPVQGLSNIDRLVAGRDHTCARRKTDDALLCWGEYFHGQLGNSLIAKSWTPLRIIPP